MLHQDTLTATMKNSIMADILNEIEIACSMLCYKAERKSINIQLIKYSFASKLKDILHPIYFDLFLWSQSLLFFTGTILYIEWVILSNWLVLPWKKYALPLYLSTCFHCKINDNCWNLYNLKLLGTISYYLEIYFKVWTLESIILIW